MGLVYTCFSSLGLPSVSQGLCELALAFQACSLHHRSCLHLSRLPRPTLYACGLYALVLVLWTHFLCHEVCVHCRGLYASPLWALLGLTSAPRELSALERFVCCPTLGYLGPPSVMWGLCLLQRFACCPSHSTWAYPLHLWLLWASLNSLTLLSGLGHSPWAFMGWEVQLSVFCLLNPCFVQLLRFFSSLLGPSVRELPRAQELFLLHDSHPASGHKLPSRSSPSFPFLCLYSLPYFITGSLVYPHGGSGYSRVCFVGIIPYHDEFFMYLWGGRPDDLPVLLLCLLHQTSFLMKWYSVS